MAAEERGGGKKGKMQGWIRKWAGWRDILQWNIGVAEELKKLGKLGIAGLPS